MNFQTEKYFSERCTDILQIELSNGVLKLDRFEIDYSERVIGSLKETIKEENKTLTETKLEILRQREYFNDYFAELKEDEQRDLLQNEFMTTKSYEILLNSITRMSRQLRYPYFAGFDFEEDDSEFPEENRFYLGIHTVRDPETGEYLVYDWRAPMAALYYEQEPGKASYEAPLGTISGVLKEKRRYVFKDGKLTSVSKLIMPSDDEMLCEVLSSPGNDKMKTIIETIQQDQHKIIRDFTEGLSVLQGCAGSGKSSIALHKIAYIMYANRKEIKDKKIVIVSPNAYFTEYISSVLPNLGEDNVTCYNPENIIDEVMGNAVDFNYLTLVETKIYQETLNAKERKMLCKERDFKCSRKFLDIIKKYRHYLERTVFKEEDLYIDEDYEKYVSKEKIREAYDLLGDMPPYSRVQDMAKAVCEGNHLDYSQAGEYICGVINDMFSTFSVSSLYRKMFTDTDFMEEIGDTSLPAYVPEKFLWEDACAISLLTYFMYGEMFENDIFYMIADEAQDFAPVFLEVINKCFKRSNMLFVGDKSQTVFGNTGNYIEDIRSIIRKKPQRIYNLTVNYRSTKQIMSFANEVAGNNETSKINCIRDGEEPEKITVDKKLNAQERLLKAREDALRFILEKYNQGYDHALVTAKNASTAEFMKNNMILPYDCNAKVDFLPVYLAKGLEYDTVVVIEDREDPFDRSSLYTACTRAMHFLRLIEV